MGGGGGLKKNFSALRSSVWSKNKGGGLPGPSPAATDFIPGTPVLSEYLLAHWKHYFVASIDSKRRKSV